MSAVFFLSSYCALSLLMSAAALIAVIIFSANQRWKFLKFGDELKLNYALLLAPVIFLGVKSFVPHSAGFEPIMKVWATDTAQNFPKIYSQSNHQGFLSLSSFSPLIEVGSVLNFSGVLLLVAVLIWGLLMARDLLRLRKILKSAYQFKHIGKIFIDWSEEIIVPFSYWIPGRRGVVLPTKMLENPEQLRISILHEFQHQRQNDTQLIYFTWIYKILNFWNPAIYIWNRCLSEIQEFACDESLVDQSKVASQAYASCLFEVAKQARHQESGLSCATGLSFLTGESLIKRRIQRMITSKQKHSARYFAITATCAVALLTGVAAASNNIIQDRRITLKEAQAMAQNAGSKEFPMVVNDLVLKQLNRFLGTADGRDYMRKSFERMKAYEPLIISKLEEYKLPKELMAIPVIESGYQNLPERNKVGWGAGLWMFMARTANHMGMRVDKEQQIDERMSPEIETDFAMRLLGANYLMLRKNWELAILAYNAGDGKVQEGFRKTGSYDAWDLIRANFDNDADYLPKVIAAAIIMKNPEALN